MDLFDRAPGAGESREVREPLAARLRPRTLDEIAGQDHILGPGRLLRRAIEADRLQSLILFGPPGCGKTSLAEVIAQTTHRVFERTSGVLSNVAVLRELFDAAARRRQNGVETILFIDEIHRFNKAQQDVLLPHVEDGTVTLIGATTHNPQVFVNSPLTSRSLVFELRPLGEKDIVGLMERALTDPRGLGGLRAALDADAALHLARLCDGDARRALNAIEVAVLTTPADADGTIRVTAAIAADSIQRKLVVYDRDEDGHYDTISAFIKSVRGSDPDAAVYWLAKMLEAGEDPRFIARRLVILASEDIGNADPRGLTLAAATVSAVEFVGMPEARIVLSQATTYLACAPKSNAAYLAIDRAAAAVRNGRTLEVPRALRNLRVRTADAGPEAAEQYIYPHDFDGHIVAQTYVPTTARFYEPTGEGYEEVLRQRLARWRGRTGRAGAASNLGAGNHEQS
jgi:putative ATPase